MLAYERRREILEAMRRSGRAVTVEQLCKELYASGATIRRDLKELESGGLLRRTRGGAVLVEGGNTEDPLIFRENQNSWKKRIISEEAAGRIRDGMTLFLDSSSTVFTLAQSLGRFQSLKVITNGLKASLVLSEIPRVAVMCTGGTLRENSKSLVGQYTCEYISRFNADLAFLSCRGFSVENGVSEANEEECHVKRRFMEQSKRSILLCDTSKMDEDFLCRLSPLSAFHEVITEKAEANEYCNRYTAHGEER